MWSGRLKQPLDPAFEQWQRSFPFDRVLITEELAASTAHAHALVGAGVLTVQEAEHIAAALKEIGEKVKNDPRLLESQEAEDVHHFVELMLVAVVGELGYKLHSGRSRNEQIATDLRLFARKSIDRLQAALTNLLQALVARAEEAGEAAMPAYTHSQRAEPVLVAHWLLAYFAMLLRDLDRLVDCRARVNVCPLGSGAVAGSGLKLDREATAAELGFDGITQNSIDATSDRDFVLEFLHCCSFVALHLSRLAEEMVMFATAEFAFIALPDQYSTGSSALPQKKNPDAMELIRGKVGRICAAAHGIELTIKSLPLAYNKDLQESQEPLLKTAPEMLTMVEIATGFLKEVKFNFERMQQAATTGYMNAIAAANYLARKGLAFRLAHKVVGEVVQLCLERGCAIEDLSTAELRKFSLLFGDDFKEALKLKKVLAGPDLPGGTAPIQVKQALQAAKEKLGSKLPRQVEQQGITTNSPQQPEKRRSPGTPAKEVAYESA
ncbi:MAG TPA: argininosuccinate lyase [Terriglobales bacterium]